MTTQTHQDRPTHAHRMATNRLVGQSGAMTDIADRYERLAAAFVEKVVAVPADGWSAPTPCEEWTARDLVRHVVDAQGMFQGLVGREMGELPSVDDDPEAAVRVATGRTLSDLRDPERAEAEFDGFFGRTSFETAVDRFLSTDLVIHGWDLARAAGLDDTIPAAEMARIREHAAGFGDALRSPGAFGPEIEVPEDASEQEKFVAFLGRTP